jgi:glycosyltransferase involved in cell wall biosynthesis
VRLLVISQYFWPEEFRINDLVQGLVARGHEVTVLTGLPNYPSGHFARGFTWAGPYRGAYEGAAIVRVPLLPRRGGGGIALALNYLSFVLSSCLFGTFRCRGQFDAILVYQPSPVTVGIPARLLGWLKRAPVLFWIQDLWPESLSATGAIRSPVVLGCVGALVRWIYRGCVRVLVQSEAFITPVREAGVDPARICYFPNSAETLYRPLPHRGPWQGPDLPVGFRVMFAGNVGAAQSFETILAAAEHLKRYSRIHWLIVGDGRMMSWVREEIVKRGLADCVHLLGRHPVSSIPSWFAQADAMLVALRRDPIFSMTIPAKLQSYMACGRPVIAALDGEGARVVAASGAGVAVPADDPPALAAAVLDLSNFSGEELAAMGARGREYFEGHFDRDLLLDRLEGWMREVQGGSQ